MAARSFEKVQKFAKNIVLLLFLVHLVECIPLNDLELQLEDDIEARKVRHTPDISLKPGGQMSIVKRDSTDRDRLDIFCYPGIRKKDLWRLWTSCTLRLALLTDKYEVYTGPNATDVYRQHHDATMSWLYNMVPWRSDNMALAVFNKTCVGVVTEADFKVLLVQKAIDPWLVSYLLSGLLLFFMAKKLSRNMMFYYGTGIGFGLFASLLILVFIMSRFMPKKYGAYAILLGGWSVSLWLLQYLWENVQSILEQYMEYVAGYFVTAGVLSFAVLYYKGPVTNPRMINLITWTLQAVALALIYNGTQLPEISATIIAVVIVLQMIKLPSFSPRNYTFWWRWLPRLAPRPHRLTEEEYMREGREETRKALADLREHCRSPDCDAWKTISRLNSPQRFATFVEGSPHLSDQEMYEFDSDPAPLNFEDSDESEISFRLSAR